MQYVDVPTVLFTNLPKLAYISLYYMATVADAIVHQIQYKVKDNAAVGCSSGGAITTRTRGRA